MSLNLLLAKDIAMAALNDRLRSAFTAVGTLQPSRALSLGDLGSAGTRGLTRRELDVLQAVARGESNKRIANRLSMREPTVKSPMRVILKKIGSNNRTQAATWAVSHGTSAATHLPGAKCALNHYPTKRKLFEHGLTGAHLAHRFWCFFQIESSGQFI